MIYLGADHGGYQLKEKVKFWLKEWKLKFEDLGAKKLDSEDDYPQFAFAVAEKVGNDKESQGILICRSSGGMIIAANKVRGVRAVAAFNPTQAKHAREHNHANIIGISGDWSKDTEVKTTIKTFLDTKFSKEERHRRRVSQIRDYESEDYTGAGCCGGNGCGSEGGCGHD